MSATHLEDAYLEGVKAASERFKVAFGSLLSMGASMLAPVAGRAALTRFAPTAAKSLARRGALANTAFDMGTMAAADKAMGQR